MANVHFCAFDKRSWERDVALLLNTGNSNTITSCGQHHSGSSARMIIVWANPQIQYLSRGRLLIVQKQDKLHQAEH